MSAQKIDVVHDRLRHAGRAGSEFRFVFAQQLNRTHTILKPRPDRGRSEFTSSTIPRNGTCAT